jgi:hypothetical protein
MASIEVATKIQIISNALILCGEKPLNSLNDDRYGATVGANLFEFLYENEIQTGSWRFSFKKASLGRLASSPLNQFQYAYQLPSDCLMHNHVWPACRYEIFGRHLYTDMTAVDLDYKFKPEITDLPAYFTLMLTYALAKDMAKPITGQTAMADKWEKAYMRQLPLSMAADAKARPSTPIQSSPFTDVR